MIREFGFYRRVAESAESAEKIFYLCVLFVSVVNFNPVDK